QLCHIYRNVNSNVKIIKNNTQKKGAGVCRNIGLKTAIGKWLLFADSDDFFVKSFYEKVEKYFNKDYEIIYFNPTSQENDSENISNRHVNYKKLVENYSQTQNRSSEVRLRYRYFVPWSKLISHDLVRREKIIFDEVMVSNDVMFSTLVGNKATKIHADINVIYCVTKGFGTLTTKIDQKNFHTRTDVYIKYYNYLRDILIKKDFNSLELHGLGVLIEGYKNK